MNNGDPTGEQIAINLIAAIIMVALCFLIGDFD